MFTVPPTASAPNSEEPGTVENLDSLDQIERHRYIAVVMPGLRVVQPDAVHEHQHLAKGGAAKREVGLDAALAARADVDRGGQPQDVGDAVHGKRLDLLACDHRHRPRHAAKFHRTRRRRHHHGLSKVLRVHRCADEAQRSDGDRALELLTAF